MKFSLTRVTATLAVFLTVLQAAATDVSPGSDAKSDGDFAVKEKDDRLLIWDATFHTDKRDIAFGDQEEMGFGARVATPMTEKNGGRIVNSNGLQTAAKTWGQPAKWCDYAGTVGDLQGGITLMAAPTNFRESWWHNRDYGVFVANPFGRAAMKQGEQSLVTVKSGESLRITFGALMHNGINIDTAAEYAEFEELQKP